MQLKHYLIFTIFFILLSFYSIIIRRRLMPRNLRTHGDNPMRHPLRWIIINTTVFWLILACTIARKLMATWLASFRVCTICRVNYTKYLACMSSFLVFCVCWFCLAVCSPYSKWLLTLQAVCSLVMCCRCCCFLRLSSPFMAITSCPMCLRLASFSWAGAHLWLIIKKKNWLRFT